MRHLMKTETTVHEQVDVEDSRKVVIPVQETHGLLPADDAFIAFHRHKLEEVRLHQGPHIQGPEWVMTEHDLPFNDTGMVPILKHILQQAAKPEGTQLTKTALNPDWATGNYTPYRDHPAT